MTPEAAQDLSAAAAMSAATLFLDPADIRIASSLSSLETPCEDNWAAFLVA